MIEKSLIHKEHLEIKTPSCFKNTLELKCAAPTIHYRFSHPLFKFSEKQLLWFEIKPLLLHDLRSGMNKAMILNSKISSQTTQSVTRAFKLNIQKALFIQIIVNIYLFNQIVVHQKFLIIKSDLLKCKYLNLMINFIKRYLQSLEDKPETIWEDRHLLLIRSNRMILLIKSKTTDLL